MIKMNNNIVLIAGIFAIIAIVAIAGCTGSASNNPTGTPDASTAASPGTTGSSTTPNGTTGSSAALTTNASQPVTIRFGIIPGSDTTQTVMTKYEPLRAYLENSTGYKWELYVGTDYTSVITAMQTKHIEVGSYGPLSYAVAADNAGAQAFAQGLDKNGDLYYHSTIQATPAVAQALGITTPLNGTDGLKTLKTKLDAHQGQYTLAYVDPESTSGYGVFRGTASIVGLDPSTEFKKTAFLGGHPAVGLAVAAGTSDMGVMSDSTLNKMLSDGEIKNGSVVELWVSDPIPNSPIAYRSDLPQDEKDKIANAFINAPSDVLVNSTGSYSFKAADDSVYAPVHDLAIALSKLTT
ncbi:MAG TPA: phosphate/phosphite/phosphonate ABC transporter substrate-binding protein [Methanocella sp.]|nr:phosphate/phosphite/phosphonate ABC transporter substrate-binding protein [Methanocella sp.]